MKAEKKTKPSNGKRKSWTFARANIPLKHNPIHDYDAWLRNKGKGCDLILPDAQVEIKTVNTRIYHSWIIRSYIPRYNLLKKYNILVVIGDKWLIPVEERQFLYLNHIRIMSLDEFINWFIKHYSKNTVKANKVFLNKLWLNKSFLNDCYLLVSNCVDDNMIVFYNGIGTSYKHIMDYLINN